MRYEKPRIKCSVCGQELTRNGMKTHVKFKHPEKLAEYEADKEKFMLPLDGAVEVPVAEPVVTPVVEPIVKPVVKPIVKSTVKPVVTPVIEPVAKVKPPAPAEPFRNTPQKGFRLFRRRV